MGSRVDSFQHSNSLSEIKNLLKDLKTMCISNPGNAGGILFDTLDQLQVMFEELSSADEELMRQNEGRLALALSTGRLGTWDWCMTTGEAVWNDEHSRMMGYKPGEVEPSFQAWVERLHPDDRVRIEAEFAGSLEQGGDYSSEFRALWPDGTVIWIEARGHVDRDAAGQPIRAFGVMIDTTERKRAEAELRRSRDELELRVQERTNELVQANKKLEAVNINLITEIKEHKKAEEQLLKAKEAAEAAARAKVEFMANMSHEIRTPMNSVIGFTSILLDEPLSPEQRDCLETIRINGDALLTIINDILDFSKMESDKVVLEEYQFNLRKCVEEAIDLVSAKAAENGLNLAYIVDKEVPDTIIGDPGRLRQILGNLLSNAVKFTDKGEVVLSVSSREVDGSSEVHFAIRDTGIGISNNHMDRLFQPFGQMEPSATRLYGGTGLGLVISKKLVEIMGGQIWAESEEGQGSTFRFTIRASSGQLEPQQAAVLVQMVGKRALIVEDNRTNRHILSKQAYDWGMIPIAAASGQEALKYIQRGDDFDIAILDMDLQTMDSFELEEEIRKYNKTLPMVLLASLGERIPPTHAHLIKPIKPSQLYKVLTDVLPIQPAQRAIMASDVNQPVQNSPLRILFAEDNVSSQKVAQQMLRRLGYKVDIVANGIEALQALERQHYDIVLMDIKMPEMDGLEATRIIRQRWPDNGPKIIAITAYALEGDREKCLEAGMDDYIPKPVMQEDLAKALEKYRPEDCEQQVKH